jgi:transcription-repair coupling factor (superfamily II helicase)
VRLEFFGDELESIRYFQPESQLTRDRIEKIELTPGGELGILKQQIEKNPNDEIKEPFPFFNLLDYLTQNACILDTEPVALQEAAEHYMQQIPEDDPYFLDWYGLLKRFEDGGFKRAELREADHDGTLSLRTLLNLHPWIRELSYILTLNPWNYTVLWVIDVQKLISQKNNVRISWIKCTVGFAKDIKCWWSVTTKEKANASRKSGMNQGSMTLPTQPQNLHLLTGSLSRGFVADSLGCAIVTDAEIFGRYKVQRPRRLKSPHAAAAKSILQIDFADLEEGDYVVHLQHGIGRYVGLRRLPPVGSQSKDDESGPEYLVIEYAAKDYGDEPPKLYVAVSEAHLVSKYIGAGKGRPQLKHLGWSSLAKCQSSG